MGIGLDAILRDPTLGDGTYESEDSIILEAKVAGDDFNRVEIRLNGVYLGDGTEAPALAFGPT